MSNKYTRNHYNNPTGNDQNHSQSINNSSSDLTNLSNEDSEEYDQGIGQLEHGTGRLDSQLGISLGNINSIDDLNFIC